MIPVILAVAVVCVSIYLYARKILKPFVGKQDWIEQGVPVLSPDEVFPKDKVLGISERYTAAYNYYKSKGHKHYVEEFFNGLNYIPLDNELVKHILIKDFDYFRNRGFDYDENIDPLNAHNLFNTKDNQWRKWRLRLTPTFTTGKMKAMYPLVAKCAEPLTSIFDGYVKSKDPMDIKELAACFTTDVLATCAFGLECNSLKNPDSEFRAYGREYMKEVSRFDLVLPKYALLLPKSWQMWLSPRYSIMKEITSYFTETVRKTIEYRETNNIVRKDFVHMLIQIKNRGTVAEDDHLGTNEVKKENATLKELAGQSFAMYLGGFDTSATLITFMCYELSTHPDVQDKLREDIQTNIQKYGGLTYEAIHNMSYLEKVIDETLRLHPPIPTLMRSCVRDYAVPGTKVVLKKGTPVQVMACASQRDPEYYPDPDNFNPDNFDKEAVAKRPMSAFMPFGDGPRNCIGLRFGRMQTRVGIATLIKDFRIKLNSKTQQPVTYDPRHYLPHVKGNLYLDLERVN